MSILIFIIVLVVLIVAHEFGHFVVAKLSRMRVDEFGIGYPPRALGFRKGETEYTLNWLPFGGFVKIYGEDGDAATAGNGRAFSDKPRILQALVLVAGIAMNLLLAWVLISTTLVMGTPRVLSPEEALRAEDATLMVASVLPGSPAANAGLAPGDAIAGVLAGNAAFEGAQPDAFTAFIASQAPGAELAITVTRGGESLTLSAVPEAGVVEADPERLALGLGIASVGTVPVPLWEAPWEGALLTWEATRQTAIGLGHFFIGLFTFTADLAQVSGPVGIAGAVGTASENGLAALLSITAIISINLALINLLPIPALDGGRLLFVIIETVIRKRIPSGVAGAVNAAGFALLLLLMFVVTANDIFRLLA